MIFTEVTVNAGLNRTVGGTAKWGDYDNDGDVDILITGDDHYASMAVLEQDNGQFTELLDASFDTLGGGELSWGDYDDDGDLDVLATGAEVADDEVIRRLFILKNEITTKDNPPGAPGEFTITAAGENSYLLSWSAATDGMWKGCG